MFGWLSGTLVQLRSPQLAPRYEEEEMRAIDGPIGTAAA